MTDASKGSVASNILPCGCWITKDAADILCSKHAVLAKRLVPDDIGLWWRWNPIIAAWETEPVFRIQGGEGGLFWNWTEYYPVKVDGLWGGRVNVPTWTPKEKQ